MFKYLKKEFIVLLAILIPVYAFEKVFSENILTKATNSKVKSENNLITSVEWKKLSDIWQKLNHIDNGGNHNNIKGIYDKITSSKAEIEPCLKRLFDLKLISGTEKDFLLNQFSNRIQSLPSRSGMVTCYDVSFSVLNTYKAQEDLEKQYDLLEKLAKENKISEEAYKTVKQSINKDLAELTHSKSISQKEQLNDALIKLLYNLSK